MKKSLPEADPSSVGSAEKDMLEQLAPTAKLSFLAFDGPATRARALATLQCIFAGGAPPWLLEEARKTAPGRARVSMRVVDYHGSGYTHMDAWYAPQREARIAWTGSTGGHTLGTAAPKCEAAVVQDGAGMPAPALPAGAAAASMQVRLANGQRLLVTLAPEHTVRDLQRVVAGAHATGGKPFVLKAGFPPRVLEDPAATVEAAGLSGCAVTQMAV